MTKAFKKSSRRGAIATLLVFLILSVIMLIAFGLSTIFVKEIKTSFYVSHSAAAYYAAESGIEYALYQMNPSGLNVPTGNLSETLSNDAYFTVTWQDGAHATSTGTYLKNNRRIEIGY